MECAAARAASRSPVSASAACSRTAGAAAGQADDVRPGSAADSIRAVGGATRASVAAAAAASSCGSAQRAGHRILVQRRWTARWRAGACASGKEQSPATAGLQHRRHLQHRRRLQLWPVPASPAGLPWTGQQARAAQSAWSGRRPASARRAGPRQRASRSPWCTDRTQRIRAAAPNRGAQWSHTPEQAPAAKRAGARKRAGAGLQHRPGLRPAARPGLQPSKRRGPRRPSARQWSWSAPRLQRRPGPTRSAAVSVKSGYVPRS